MPSPVANHLRSANANLRARLAGLLTEPNASAPLQSESLTRLLADLLCAADCWRSIPPDSAPDAELENAKLEYRSIVEQLALVLPGIHGRLLTDKARLEIAQAHIAATTAWAQASQKSL